LDWKLRNAQYDSVKSVFFEMTLRSKVLDYRYTLPLIPIVRLRFVGATVRCWEAQAPLASPR